MASRTSVSLSRARSWTKMMAEKRKPEGCATSVVRCGGKDACALSSPRQKFVATASRLPTIAIHDIGLKVATGLSLSEQTRRWGCLLDIRGNGFSARVPALLHTNRTLLFVLRHVAFQSGRPHQLALFRLLLRLRFLRSTSK